MKPTRSLFATLVVVSLLVGCDGGPAPGAPWFVDATADAGLDFVHFNGMTGDFYFCEHMPGGGALFDYDGDGDLDLYAIQGSLLNPERELSDAIFPPVAPGPPKDRLYRNDLMETGRLQFIDVTDASGIDARGYGMGAAVGDYDRDGHPDLYLTQFGENRLFRNRGDGTFEDVTLASGATDDRWSSSAAFVDYDADGWPDLFIANYVDFNMANHKECFSESSARDYCGPLSYSPVPDRLYRNNGDGTFTDVTAVAQIAREYGAGLGVVAADFNGDKLLDIYVANDTHANQLWGNRGDGTFRDDALLSGSALNRDGKAEASMGLDAADYDNDGDEDLFMTHLTDETNTLFRNDGSALFEDRTFEAGLGVASRPFTGFGAAWLDYDNDGWLDLFAANGAAETIEELARAGDRFPLSQTNQLFRNLGDGRFEETTARAGPVFELASVSRGAAFGDVDNDGDTDVVVFNNSGPLRLLVNQVGQLSHWVGLRVVDRSGRDAIHARVEIVLGDGRSLWRRARVAASYLTANDPRVLAGLGTAGAVDAVRVHWTDGVVEQWDELPIDTYTTLQRGSGRPVQR